LKHPPVATDATLRAEQAGRVLLAQLIREGRTNTEIARVLRIARGHLVPVINEIREELAELGERHLRPVDLDKLQGACQR
jgi:hypothetical protein